MGIEVGVVEPRPSRAEQEPHTASPMSELCPGGSAGNGPSLGLRREGHRATEDLSEEPWVL